MTTTSALKERPILFKGGMVRSLLSGRKTQTRRLMDPQPEESFSEDRDRAGRLIGRRSYGWSWQEGGLGGYRWDVTGDGIRGQSPFGLPGDRLWVRESFCPDWGPEVLYRADDPTGWAAREAGYPSGPRWRPSIHMPRHACRIVLAIEDIRVQRIQAIGDEEILAEGVGTGELALADRAAWVALWDRINAGRYAWDRNPWAWAITFRVEEGD